MAKRTKRKSGKCHHVKGYTYTRKHKKIHVKGHRRCG
jgi:hypothetical protein